MTEAIIRTISVTMHNSHCHVLGYITQCNHYMDVAVTWNGCEAATGGFLHYRIDIYGKLTFVRFVISVREEVVLGTTVSTQTQEIGSWNHSLHVWTHVMIFVKSNYPPMSPRFRPRPLSACENVPLWVESTIHLPFPLTNGPCCGVLMSSMLLVWKGGEFYYIFACYDTVCTGTYCVDKLREILIDSYCVVHYRCTGRNFTIPIRNSWETCLWEIKVQSNWIKLTGICVVD